MPAILANPTERGRANHLAKDKVRLRNPATGELLHLSGKGSTRNLHHSWLGFHHQAETLRSRAAIRGDDWPFVTVHRDLLDPMREAHDA